MIQLVHELPTRLRFTVPQLRGDRRGGAAFCARVRALGGVIDADLIPLTGSLIVRHDGLPETRDRIFRNLESFAPVALPPEPAEPPPASVPPATAPARLDQRIADAVADALAERLAERLVRMAVAALI
jgi:hypothetical protein